MTGFSARDMEMHQAIVHLLRNVLELDVDITITYDIDHFNSYGKDKLDPEKLVGATDVEQGLVWLNPELAKHPIRNTISTIAHELLHIRYPKAKEREIVKLTEKLVKERNRRFNSTIGVLK